MKNTKKETKQKIGYWLHPSTRKLIEERGMSGDFKNNSDFVEKAILFYNGVLDTEENKAFLGEEIIRTMKAISQNTEGRILSSLRSMDISISMLTLLFAYSLADMSKEEVQYLRKEAVDYVNENRRAVSFVTALKAEQDKE